MLQIFKDVFDRISGKDKPTNKELFNSGGAKETGNRERKTGYDVATLRNYWKTSAVIGASVDDMAMSICGAGFAVAFKDIDTDQYIPLKEMAEPVNVLRVSRQQWVVSRAVHDALKVGNGYILKQNVNGKIMRIVPIPPDNVEIARDDRMTVLEYVQNVGEEDKNPRWIASDVIHVKCLEETGEAYGISVIERVAEDDDIMRNLKLDLAEVMEMMAYPTDIYKCGTPEKPWAKGRIQKFLSDLSDTTIGKIVGVNGDVEVVNREMRIPDISPVMTLIAASELNGIGVPATQTGLVTNAGDAIVEKQKEAYMKRVTHYRVLLKELFEIELFDPLLESWGYKNVKAELMWLPLPGEDERMSVNNVIQLKQNGIATRDYCQYMLGFPVGVDMPGEYETPVDKAEGATPELQPEDDTGTSEDIKAKGGTDDRNGGY